jgi:hypothetical protein
MINTQCLALSADAERSSTKPDNAGISAFLPPNTTFASRAAPTLQTPFFAVAYSLLKH